MISLAQTHSSPLSPCLETTRAAGKAIGRRLCPSTRLFAARSTSPRLCPVLECPARLGCSRPRLETGSASLSPRRRPPLQCLCTTRRLTLSPPPTAFNPRPSSPLSYPRHPCKPPPSLLSLASLCLIHLSQDSEQKPPPFPFPP